MTKPRKHKTNAELISKEGPWRVWEARSFYVNGVHGKTKKPYYWVTLVAKNGRVLFTSETYPRLGSAHKAINAVEKIFGSDRDPTRRDQTL